MYLGTICLITSKAQFKKYVQEVNRLISLKPKRTSRNGKRLLLLFSLLQIYVTRLSAKDFPTPLEAILHCMKRRKLKPKDLVEYIGPQSVVSKVLSGQRALTLKMIRKLNEGLALPADVLIREMKIKKRGKK